MHPSPVSDHGDTADRQRFDIGQKVHVPVTAARNIDRDKVLMIDAEALLRLPFPHLASNPNVVVESPFPNVGDNVTLPAHQYPVSEIVL